MGALKSQVGGHRLDLEFDAPACLARAEELLTGFPDADRLLLSTPSDGTANHLHRVLDDLRAAGVPVARVSSHRPTLDDVFVALTAGVPAPRSTR